MKAQTKPVWSYYLSVAILLLGLVTLGSIFLTGTAPRVIRRVGNIPAINQDPAVIAEAMMTQESIQYPGPVPTQPLGPGTPTPSTLEQVRNVLKWGPYSLGLAQYVLEDEGVIYVVFEPTYEPYGAPMTAEHAKAVVATILRTVSEIPGDYDYLVIHPGSRHTNGRYSSSAYKPFRLVYSREIVLAHKDVWFHNGDLYSYAVQKDIPPQLQSEASPTVTPVP
jgi:hypothetical protein